MLIEIRITGGRAAGKSTVAHVIAAALRRLGFVHIQFYGVAPEFAIRTLSPQQLDTPVMVCEGADTSFGTPRREFSHELG